MSNFEKLKTILFTIGHEAIADFLGYGYPFGEEKDATENRMDEVYQQMPDEELQKYYNKYNI